MDLDKIEIISEQLLALTKLWHLLLSSTFNSAEMEISAELLLEILETKQQELQYCLKPN